MLRIPRPPRNPTVPLSVKWRRSFLRSVPATNPARWGGLFSRCKASTLPILHIP
jgi:hypothetical protein